MAASVASEVKQPTGIRQAAGGVLESPLFLILASLLILFAHILHNGYECFRSDHITQIPLIYLKDDPTLFPRDWFLTRFGHFDIRFFHLFLIRVFSILPIRLFSAPLGLPLGLLALYFVLILATLGAWVATAKKVYGSPLPGLVAGVAAVYAYGLELGSNHLLEVIMIPRTEAYAFAYWGLFCVLTRRPLAAGVLFGLSAYCQMAIGGFFALPVLIWLLAGGMGGGRERWKAAGLFLAGFVLMMLYPLLTKTKGFLTRQTVTDEEAIQLSAYIRHPHHMVPHLWGGQWVAFVMLAILAFGSWERQRRDNARVRALGGLALIIAAILALATVFIEIIPVKNIVMGQPYRMAVLLYFLLLLLLAPHLLGLLRAEGVFPKARAVLLVLGMVDWQVFSALALLELALSATEERGKRLPAGWSWGLLLAALVGGVILRHGIGELRHELGNILELAVPVTAILAAAERFGLWQRPRLLWSVGGGIAAAGLIMISSFYWLPYEKWINDESNDHRRKYAERVYKYEFNPIPIMALERLGVWAQKNTPRDALFLIPPEREAYGFHLWSKRSVVFAFKFFPYNPAGLGEWKERFLAMQGIMETESDASKAAIGEAMSDIGGELVNDTFFGLDADQVLALAGRYGADYIITRARYDHPQIRELTNDYHRTKSRKANTTYYLYKIEKMAR